MDTDQKARAEKRLEAIRWLGKNRWRRINEPTRQKLIDEMMERDISDVEWRRTVAALRQMEDDRSDLPELSESISKGWE